MRHGQFSWITFHVALSTNKDRTNTQAGFISIFMKITHPSSFRIFFVQRLKVELSFANTLKYLPFPNIAHSFLSLPASPPPPLLFFAGFEIFPTPHVNMFETSSIKGRKLSRIALVLLYFVIWLVQETRATFRPVENKMNRVTLVFPRFNKLLSFTLSSHRLVRFSMLWLVVVIVSVSILRHAIEKRFVM